MKFTRFGKCGETLPISRIYHLIPPQWIGITLKSGISPLSTIPPNLIPRLIILNQVLISHIFLAVKKSVTNVAIRNWKIGSAGDNPGKDSIIH